MIINKDGRTNSIRTIEEEKKLFKEIIDKLSPEEKEAFKILMKEMSSSPEDSPILTGLNEIEYKHPPVDMRTFIKDDYFLGKSTTTLFPKVFDYLVEWCDSGYYDEVILTGAIGTGKTFGGSIAICRIIYEISCMKHPHRAYNIAPGSNISIVCFSVNQTLATKVVFENIVNKLDTSGYFKDHYPYEKTKTELRFPENIWVAPRATTDTAALGLNVIAALMDEGNFIPTNAGDEAKGIEDRAQVIYNSLKARLKSRFPNVGRLPRGIFILSSKQTHDDFTSRRIKEAEKDPHVFVRDYSIWDVRPEGTYSKKRFWVFVGNDHTPSRILEDHEVEYMQKNLPEGCLLIDIPEDFYPEFDLDLERSIRDLAGISTTSVSPYISKREKINEAIDVDRKHPFSQYVHESGSGGTFDWKSLVRPRLERKDKYSNRAAVPRPILNPDAPRHVHIDSALRNDALGFCIGHVGGWKDVERVSQEGKLYVERAPIYVIDLMMKIVAPTGGEIDLGSIRQMIFEYTEHGYTITKVTADQYQSADSLQILRKKGYATEEVSVDRSMEPYDNLKMALYEQRLHYYEYEPLLKELRELELHFVGGSLYRRRKVDHNPKSSKDIADALAAVCHTLSKQQEAVPLPFVTSIDSSNHVEESWLPEVKGTPNPVDVQTNFKDHGILPPFLVGDQDYDDWGDY